MVSQTLDFTPIVEKLLNVEQFWENLCVFFSINEKKGCQEDIVTHIPTNNMYIYSSLLLFVIF
jgi:hypothetical protein